MRKDKFSGIKELFQRKGFYVALYSCIAVLLVAAVLITYSSLSDFEQGQQEVAQDAGIDFEDMQQTSGKGYLTPDDKEATKVALGEVPQEFIISPEVNGDYDDFLDDDFLYDDEDLDWAPLVNAELDEDMEMDDEEKPEEDDAPLPAQEDALYEEDDEISFVMNDPEEIEEILADPVFSVYNGEDDMIWPVLGDVVMDYSIERVIYDATLDQYRTNDNICIQAGPGTQVKAAADGVVKSVSNSREEGNYIIVEHGNGWCTTYSQLQDGILVAEGDVVTAGQVIGGVGNPSIYTVSLGSHLGFRISKDEQTVNPVMVLAQ